MDPILGIDIGGSGIKGAIIDPKSGDFISDKHRIPTPETPSPDACGKVLKKMVKHFQWEGYVGCGFPGIVKNDTVHSAVNLHKDWLQIDFPKYFAKHTDCQAAVVNDADAAGLAELYFGAAKDLTGLTILLTIGTGVGSCLILNGHLSPNSELGHLQFKSKTIETYASNAVKEGENLSWKDWAIRFNETLQHLDFLFNPDTFVIGGGVAKKFDRFESEIKVEASCVPAVFKNRAGIIGAACAAMQKFA